MQYTSRIILDNKLQMLQGQIYRDIRPIEHWETRALKYIKPLIYEPIDDWSPIALGDHWRARYNETQLFRTRVKLPAKFAGRKPVLVLDIGGEGQVRINGEIISGVTSQINGNYLTPQVRSRVYIPDKYGPGDILNIEVEACLNFLEFTYAITLKEQAQFAEYTLRTAFLAVADEETERYWFDLCCAVEALDTFANPVETLQNSNARILDPTVQKLMNALNSDSFLHKRLFTAIMESIDALDLEFGWDALRASIPVASEILKRGLESIPHKATAMVKFVGQAHIDTAWLWPLKETVRKCGKTFSNVVSLMERYPEFIFAFSQPQLFAYTEEFYPELFEKVRDRVEEGRIELVGNAWVEMDTNVPSGEALVRQLLYGRQYFMEKFGKASRVFWMPDVFGYTWALPQIMKRSGIDYFFTSKLVNNDTNRFPHSLFMWQGVDGTRILSYLQRLGYNGELDAATLSEIYAQFDQKDVCDTVLMTIGYGDGGGGPSYQMLEKADRLKDFPGLPRSEIATSLSFFEEAEKSQSGLPVWNDEMYYEFHRGTYTSQAHTKRNNRKGELLLRRVEIACAIAHARLGVEYPARHIGNIWKKLLTNQFHDILPGSSIHQVYEDCERIYADIFAEANALYDKAIDALNRSIGLRADQIAVWNFLGWSVTDTVTAVIDGKYTSLCNAADEYVPAQATYSDGRTEFKFEAHDIPPFGVAVFTAKSEPAQSYVRQNDIHTLENDYLRLTLDDDGNISSLYDKHSKRETLERGKPSNLLTIFEDIPHRESAWNIDIEYQNKYWNLIKAESVELIENSPVRAAVRVVRRFNLSTITQDIVLAHSSKRIDFVTHVDWHETQHMLKTAFWPDILASRATYEIQFGAIERPTHWNTSYDKARFEVCGHKWADLSEGGYGVSILNDCKYGYDIRDNRMRLTLLRAPNYPDATGDKGEHDFTYSIYPHAGNWREGGTVRAAYELNVPLMAYAGRSDCVSKMPKCFAICDMQNVVVDSIKGAEDSDGLIMRAYESQGARCNAHIDLGFEITGCVECNLMEDNEQDIPLSEGGFDFYIRPYEIKTFRLRLK